MADRPGSFRHGPKMSRHTMVMRKAREDDERRLPESADDLRRDAAVTSRREAASPEKAASADLSSRRVSGRTVIVHRDGDASRRLSVSTTRLSGRQAASVRVTGGDTIIRYQSGDMVIKRGTRRQRLRRQLLRAYGLGYLVLFGLFGWFLLTGTTTIEPQEFVERAFSRRLGTEIHDLEVAAFEAMRGNRTPAEVRLAETLSFYDENKDLIRIEAGSRLTLLAAAKLGRAIIEDGRLDPARRNFTKPLKLYKETYLATLHWPYWLTLYNALGFFLLLALFLWRPLLNYLGTEGKKVAVNLRNSRDAQAEAADYRQKYRDFAASLEERGDAMRERIRVAAEAEREKALDEARRQAGDIAGGIEGALDRVAGEQSLRLGERLAIRACDRAGDILRERLGQAEHDAAIDELIADINGARLAGPAGAS